EKKKKKTVRRWSMFVNERYGTRHARVQRSFKLLSDRAGQESAMQNDIIGVRSSATRSMTLERTGISGKIANATYRIDSAPWRDGAFQVQCIGS
ncbi:hypothetical protein ALC57_11317, partial [Trachymyrmex cornetzi]